MICPATPTGSFRERLRALSGTGLTWPVYFRSETAVVLETSSDIAEVVLSFDDGFTAVAGFEFSKSGCVLTNGVGEFEEHATTFLRRAAGPGSVFESVFGGSYRMVNILGSWNRELRR